MLLTTWVKYRILFYHIYMALCLKCLSILVQYVPFYFNDSVQNFRLKTKKTGQAKLLTLWDMGHLKFDAHCKNAALPRIVLG